MVSILFARVTTDVVAYCCCDVFMQTSGRRVWRNTVTGEVSIALLPEIKEQMRLTEDLVKQKELLRAKKAARKR